MNNSVDNDAATEASPLDTQVQEYQNCKNPIPVRLICLVVFLNYVQNGDFKDQIQEIRTTKDEKERAAKKAKLLAVTLSCICTEKRGSNYIKSHTGLMQVDIDHLDPEKVLAFKLILSEDRYTLACFISPSGNGLKLIVKIPANVETHRASFIALRSYYKLKYGIEIDESCSDITRLFFVSYDPELYVNLAATEFDKLEWPKLINQEKNVKKFSPKDDAEEQPLTINGFPIDDLYNLNRDELGRIKQLKILQYGLLRLMQHFGYARFEVGMDYLLVRVKNNILEEVPKTRIQGEILNAFKALPEGGLKEALLEKTVNAAEHNFADIKFSLLESIEPTFIRDSIDEIRLFYQNAIVVCTANGYSLRPYGEFEGFIWKSQIVQRDFVPAERDYSDLTNLPDYAMFIWKISGQTAERFAQFRTLIGYAVHNNLDGGAYKAIILTDSEISTQDNGQTGKGLFARSLGHVRAMREIGAKTFDPKDRFRFHEVEPHDDIVHLNDADKSLTVETLYVDIADWITVQKKNKAPFKKKAKMIISTNRPMKIEGPSAKNRVWEVELSNHYGLQHRPFDDFGKYFFGDGWTVDDYIHMDNFVASSACFYLKHGVLAPTQINLNKRKLLSETNEEFVDFMDIRVNDGRIGPGKLCKNNLRDEFLREYPEFRSAVEDVSNITKWLRHYANLSGHFAPNLPKQDETTSNSKKYFVFRPIGYKRTKSTSFVPPQPEPGDGDEA